MVGGRGKSSGGEGNPIKEGVLKDSHAMSDSVIEVMRGELCTGIKIQLIDKFGQVCGEF